MKKTTIFVCSILLFFGLTGLGHATLWDRGEGLIYDDAQDLTWYDYTYLSTTWHDAVSWADNLTVDFGSTTFSNWRLPISTNLSPWASGNDGTTLIGYNNTTSEMGSLYYLSFGRLAPFDTSNNPVANWPLEDTSPFENILMWEYDPPSSSYFLDRSLAYFYWSGSSYSDDPNNNLGVAFTFIDGFQSVLSKDEEAWDSPHHEYDFRLVAMAVMEGDVISAPVPEPTTMLLFGTGLIGLAGFRRKFKK